MRVIQAHYGRGLAAVLAASLVIAGLAGCASSSSASSTVASSGGCRLTTKPAPLALAVGIRSNVPAASYPPELASLLESAADAGQQISLVRIDGQPKIFRPPVFHTTDQNASARSRDVANYLDANVNSALASHGPVSAQVPQADVLTALSLAASATGPAGNIVLIDSGLQTVAPLDYAQAGLLMAPPRDVVAFLKQKGLVPDLHGRHVLISGFGYTAPPQVALNVAQRDNVVAQWEAVIKAGGGCAIVDTAGNTSPALTGLPEVSTVVPPKTPSFGNCGTIVLSDAGTVGFRFASAMFRDPSTAHATLQKLAVTLKHGTEHITLIGSTSSDGTDAYNNQLSTHRANTVRSVLISLGIASSRITSKGDGSHWPGRLTDRSPGGVLLPAQAEQDREVIVQLPKCK